MKFRVFCPRRIFVSCKRKTYEKKTGYARILCHKILLSLIIHFFVIAFNHWTFSWCLSGYLLIILGNERSVRIYLHVYHIICLQNHLFCFCWCSVPFSPTGTMFSAVHQCDIRSLAQIIILWLDNSIFWEDFVRLSIRVTGTDNPYQHNDKSLHIHYTWPWKNPWISKVIVCCWKGSKEIYGVRGWEQ